MSDVGGACPFFIQELPLKQLFKFFILFCLLVKKKLVVT